MVGFPWVNATILTERRMSHVDRLKDEVLHRGQGPKGRVDVEAPKIYTFAESFLNLVFISTDGSRFQFSSAGSAEGYQAIVQR